MAAELVVECADLVPLVLTTSLGAIEGKLYANSVLQRLTTRSSTAHLSISILAEHVRALLIRLEHLDDAILSTTDDHLAVR